MVRVAAEQKRRRGRRSGQEKDGGVTSQRRAVYRRRFMLEGAAARWRLSKHFPPEPMWLLRYSLALGLLALVLLVVF